MTTAAASKIPPIESLYLHIPFCNTRCGYCDFYKTIKFTPETQTLYLQALLREAAIYRERYAITEPLKTVFFGGGTPSIYSGEQLADFMGELLALFTISQDAEVTLEANPGTLSSAKLERIFAAGINRLSLGVQSFDAVSLKTLGRKHTVDEIYQAVEMARAAGFTNFSIDLIFATPNQTLERWRYDLEQAVQLQPNHISAYNLTYHEGTPYYDLLQQGQLQKLDDDLEAEMYSLTLDFLEDCGYPQYEISNFAKNGAVANHNLAYWNYDNYLGLGASAHSFVNNRRWTNIADVDGYIERIARDGRAVTSEEALDKQAQMNEMIFLALRKREGLTIAAFTQRFGQSPDTVFALELARHLNLGLLEMNSEYIRLTPKGVFMADSVFVDFMH